LRYQGCGVADVSVNLSSDLVIARDKARLELVELSRPPVCLPDDVAAKPRHLQGPALKTSSGGRAALRRAGFLGFFLRFMTRSCHRRECVFSA